MIKLDGEIVKYKYDSLGRRIEKSSNATAIKFVWNGNNPLHEWEEKPEIKRSVESIKSLIMQRVVEMLSVKQRKMQVFLRVKSQR